MFNMKHKVENPENLPTEKNLQSTNDSKLKPDAKKAKKKRKINKKLIGIIAGSLLLVFVASNLIVGYVYKDKAYPNSYIGTEKISGYSDKQLESLVPEEITIESEAGVKKEGVKKPEPYARNFKRQELGILMDEVKSTAIVGRQKGYLPVWQLVIKQQYDLPLKVSDKKFNEQLNEVNEQLRTPPQNAEIIKDKEQFKIEAEQSGKKVDRKKMQEWINTKMNKNNKTIQLPFEDEKPEISTKDIEHNRDELNTKLEQKVSIKNNDKAIVPSKQAKLTWFAKKDDSFVPSKPAIAAYLNSLIDSAKLEITNSTELTNAIYAQVNEGKAPNAELIIKTKARVIAPKRSGGGSHYTYCIQAKGISGANLSSFASKAASTLADSRSWAGSGRVSFSEVKSGCTFTLWLSAANLVPSFSSGCSASWSCRAGSNVIINADRWNGGTTAWNGAGGNINDYRSMVINHEVGHFIGFGHASCGGAGQPAPVMQQQSISLQGCKFSPWPTASELDRV